MIKLNSLIDTQLLTHSIPSLTIGLIGMIFTGYSFKSAAQHKKLIDFPFIFQASSIVGFKGNVDLGFVMHLSVKRRLINEHLAFRPIALVNSYFLIFISYFIGLIIGALSVLNVIMKTGTSIQVALEIITSSVLTCFISTVLFEFSFLLCLELAFYLSIDPESFLMPLLSTINDILIVRLLFFFAIQLSGWESHLVLGMIGLLTLLAGVCLSLSYGKPGLMPKLTIETISITFFLNIVCGFILDVFSPLYPKIAVAIPIFTGMGSSIAFIFLHKMFSSLECSHSIQINLKNTLLTISVFVSSAYLLLTYIFDDEYSLLFGIGFMALFFIHIIILLRVVEELIKILLVTQKSICSNSIPFIASISDILGSLGLLLISYLIALI